MEKVLMTIVFAIPEPFSGGFVDLNRKLSKENKTRFVSEFPIFTPHITIYQAEFPKRNESKVLEEVKSMANSSERLLFVSDKPSVKGRYVAMNFKRSKEIENFSRHVVERLSPLREGNVKEVYRNSVQNLSKEESDNVAKWGYPYVMDLYNPHVTILALDDERDAQGVAKEIKCASTFLVNAIKVVSSSVDAEGEKVSVIRDIPFSV